MFGRSLERLFDRFRRHADVGALSSVFDRTAPELLRVALHLARDPAEAEDLVQKTFLSAIEVADTFDPHRRLMPWLLGILANHAKKSARQERRTVDPARLRPRVATDPADATADSEAARAADLAIDGLPDPYRSILVLRFRHGMEPAEIAGALGVSAATVRSHLHRGLERLKRAMPGVIAMTLLAGLPASRGLGAVREIVRAKAAQAAAGLPAATAASTVLAVGGGVIMANRAVLLASAVLLLAGGGALVWRPWDSGEAASAPPETVGIESRKPPGLAGKPPGPLSANTAAAERGAVVGTARRGGRAVGARVEVYRLATLDPGVPDSWTSSARDTAARFAASGARPAATTQAAPDGRFACEGLGLGDYEVVATGTDGALGSGRARLEAEGGRASVNVDIYGGAERLLGRAVFADGRPFVGQVAAAVPGPDETPIHGLKLVPTAGEGRFVLEGIEAGEIVLIARDGGRLYVQSGPVSIPRADEFVFTVDDGLGDLSGRVVADADGAPVAGAVVVARALPSSSRAEVWTRTTTDADGAFHIASPAGDRGQMQVRAAGYASVLRPPPDPLGAVEIRLARTARVTGRVTSAADGAPVPGVDVYAFPTNDVFREGSHATSDEGGRYALADVGPGERTIFAIGHGFITKGLEMASPSGWNPFAVHVPAGGAIERDLVVVSAGRVAGRVVDPAGAQVRGAFVRWHVADSGPSASVQTGGAFVIHRAAATGDDGSFLLDAIPPGHAVEVEASAAGFSPGRAAKAVVASPSAPPSIEIRLLEPRWLDLRVEDDESHAPIVGARVVVNSNREVGHVTYAETVAQGFTSSDGTARLGPLPPGDIEAVVSAEGYGFEFFHEFEALPVVAGTTVARVHRKLSITGRARYADGTPASGGVRLTTPRSTSSTGLGPDGGFRIDQLEPGVYRLDVLPTGGEKVSRDVHAGDERIDVVVPGSKPSSLVVEVLDGDGGPVAGAAVAWMAGGFNRASVRDGHATLSAPAADAWIEVYRAVTSTGERAPWGAVAQGPIAAGATSVTIRLPPERHIEGVVVGPDGNGVAAARVTAVPVPPEPLAAVQEPHDTARSDANGRFRLGGLWDGEYRLSVVPPPEFTATAEAVSAKAGATDVVIVLRATSEVAPKVLDWRGRPVPGAEIEVILSDRFGDSRVVRTDADGVVRLAGLDPARLLEIHVKPPEGYEGALPLRDEHWRPSSEPLRLPRAFTVGGVVRDRDGRPAAGVHVRAAHSKGQLGAITGPDGRFFVPGVTEGDVQLFAVVEAPSPRRSKVVAAAAGADDVVLVMQPAASLVVRLDGFPAGETRTRARLVDATSRVSTISAQVGADGTVRFEGLDAEATYSFFASVGDPPLLAHRRDVRGSAGELRARLAPAKAIEGRVVLPAGATGGHVWLEEAGVYGGSPAAGDGSFSIDELPEGRWSLHARATGPDGVALEGHAEAESGGRVEITLTRRR